PQDAPRRRAPRSSRRLSSADLLGPHEIARHIFMMRLERPAADLEELRVAIEALHMVFARIAIAAEHLDGAIGDVLAHRRTEELHAIRVEAMPSLIELHRARRQIGISAPRHELRIALRDIFLDLTIFADGLSKALPIARVVIH